MNSKILFPNIILTVYKPQISIYDKKKKTITMIKTKPIIIFYSFLDINIA